MSGLITMESRWLTSRAHYIVANPVPLTTATDPDGVLQGIVDGGDYSYTADNEVHFHKLESKDGESK